MKFLIVYGTSEGQTRKISAFMADELIKAGHNVDQCNAADYPASPLNYDGVLIGASIHIGKYQPVVKDYIERYSNLLNNRPGAFFSVCLAIISDDEAERDDVRMICNNFLARVGWQPTMSTSIAGALRNKQYGFFKRLLMKLLTWREGHKTSIAKDYEYTNWDEVRKFALEFAEQANQINQRFKKESQLATA